MSTTRSHTLNSQQRTALLAALGYISRNPTDADRQMFLAIVLRARARRRQAAQRLRTEVSHQLVMG